MHKRWEACVDVESQLLSDIIYHKQKWESHVKQYL